MTTTRSIEIQLVHKTRGVIDPSRSTWVDNSELTFDEAETVAEWTHCGTMLPKEPGQIKELFDSGNGVAAIHTTTGEILGIAGLTYEYEPDERCPEKMIELGSLVRHPKYGGMGVAEMLTLGVLAIGADKYPGCEIRALANEKSARVFRRLGARGGISPLKNPKEVYVPNCFTCRNLPDSTKKEWLEDPVHRAGIGCCDEKSTMSFNTPEVQQRLNEFMMAQDPFHAPIILTKRLTSDDDR